MTGIIIVEIVPSSTQACTVFIDRLSTDPLMVNGSPRNTSRVDLSAGVESGAFAIVTGVDACIGGDTVGSNPAGVAFVDGDAGYDDDTPENGLKTPEGIM